MRLNSYAWEVGKRDLAQALDVGFWKVIFHRSLPLSLRSSSKIRDRSSPSICHLEIPPNLSIRLTALQTESPPQTPRMSSQSPPELPFDIPDIPALLSTWAGNAKRNTSAAFSSMTLQNWIRVIAIIGGYVLVARPVLMMLGAKAQ